jgi:phosphoribosylaminoimidazole-succinocarboxamide synthase
MSEPMSDAKPLYEGKAKIIYPTDNPDILRSYFKDDATAFNAQKKGQITQKGVMNCTISSHLFKMLESADIATHFIDQSSPNEMRVRAVSIVPLEVVVRNIAAGSLCQQTGMALGTLLKFPLVDFYYKSDPLGDPLLTEDRILLLELSTSDQIDQLRQMALKINQVLKQFFQNCSITLVDFKLEFGLDKDHRLLLADEISPDTCRLWDQSASDPNDRVLDKDRFRRDLGNIEQAYAQVMERVLAQSV